MLSLHHSMPQLIKPSVDWVGCALQTLTCAARTPCTSVLMSLDVRGRVCAVSCKHSKRKPAQGQNSECVSKWVSHA